MMASRIILSMRKVAHSQQGMLSLTGPPVNVASLQSIEFSPRRGRNRGEGDILLDTYVESQVVTSDPVE